MFNTEKSNAKELRIRQQDIADLSGVPRTTVCRWLRGNNVDPIKGARIAKAVRTLAAEKQKQIEAILQ